METNNKSIGQKDSPRTPTSAVRAKKLQTKRPRKSAPGPGDSQESERIEYHEEPARKAGSPPYDHKPEKNLEE